ncbi:hypothetical protein QTG56_24490 (plasmid) [Rossellomorea sp. AcN35-11]|nr:hypothetical protein [Rossellomorea aquimaris]WJV31794.1 hypothetical protein QTG56_24490 [Rossellomorea sp. AcN35-11]
MENRENVRWVLHTSCNDINVLGRIPKLTDEELVYCLERERRKTGQRNLLREAKKRNLSIEIHSSFADAHKSDNTNHIKTDKKQKVKCDSVGQLLLF